MNDFELFVPVDAHFNDKKEFELNEIEISDMQNWNLLISTQRRNNMSGYNELEEEDTHPLIHLRLGQVHFELGNEESTKFEVVPPPLRVNRAFQQIAHPLSHLRTVPETTVRMGLLDSLP